MPAYHCSTSCAVGAGIGLGSCFLFCVAAIVFAFRRACRVDQYAAAATLGPHVQLDDKKTLSLSIAGQPHTPAFSVTATSTNTHAAFCCGPTCGERARQSASTCNLYFDNNSRHISGQGSDEMGPFDLVGHFVLDTPHHGWMAFSRTYDGQRVYRSCAEFGTGGEDGVSGAGQSMAVSQLAGSWYIRAYKVADGGVFTMTFAQPITVVGTVQQTFPSGAMAAVPIDIAPDRAPTAPSTPTTPTITVA